MAQELHAVDYLDAHLVAALDAEITASREQLRSAEQRRQEVDRALDRLQTRFDDP